MAYSQWTSKTTADTNAAADVNQLAANIEALKGGSAASAPSKTMEELYTMDDVNVRASESGTITGATSAESRVQLYTITNTSERTLPSTNVLKGWVYHWIVPGTYAFTVKSAGSDVIETIMNASIKVVALQNAPTDKAHWRIIECKSLTVEKEYIAGNTYNSVSLTVTSAAAGFTLSTAKFIPYQSPDGAWHMKGFIRASHDSLSNVVSTVAGVSMTSYQAPAVQYGTGYASAGSFDVTYLAAYTNHWLNFDVFLDSKPTWCD